jgi:PAS domain-containing protein
MNKMIEEMLIGISDKINFSFYIFDSKTKDFNKIQNGKIDKRKIPDVIKKDLFDHDCFVKSYKKKIEIIIFYFIRIFLDDRKIIILLQDDKTKQKLNIFLNVLIKETSLVYNDYMQISRELEFMREELSACESDLMTSEEKVIHLEEELINRNAEYDRNLELVSILKNSRDKLLHLIDGLDNLLFSMNIDFEINNINKSACNFVGENDFSRMVGSKCYKIIFNHNIPCPWCKFEEVLERKESINQDINVEIEGKQYYFSQIFFPIFDEDKNVIEVGESLSDVTEQYKLINSIEKSKETIKKISRAKLEKMDEINQIKKEYESLYKDYEESKKQVEKLSKILSKVLKQTTAMDLIEFKSEIKELKTRLNMSEKMIENYKKQNDELKEEIKAVNKKSVYSLERMINVISNKKSIKDEELKKVFEFIESQIEIIKEHLKQEEIDGSESGN